MPASRSTKELARFQLSLLSPPECIAQFASSREVLAFDLGLCTTHPIKLHGSICNIQIWRCVGLLHQTVHVESSYDIFGKPVRRMVSVTSCASAMGECSHELPMIYGQYRPLPLFVPNEDISADVQLLWPSKWGEEHIRADDVVKAMASRLVALVRWS